MRVFLALGIACIAMALCVAYGFLVEPYWVCIKRIQLSPSPSVRIVHITDVHYKGDRGYLEKVVREINRLDADVVCFTGDLVEDATYLAGAMDIFSKLNKPMFGVPGNHDRLALRTYEEWQQGFRATGGEWLESTPVLIPAKHLALVPMAAATLETPARYKRVILDHHPQSVDNVPSLPFDLMLAGHTHGGQVQIPCLYRVFHDVDLGPYVRGLYQTPLGPLYVNPGIGTFHLNVRFMCRPEITLLEL